MYLSPRCLKAFFAVILLLSSFPAWAHECSRLFESEKRWQSVSLDCAPVFEMSGEIRSFPDHVLLEVERLKGSSTRRQLLLPYIDPVTHLSTPYGRALFHEVGLKAIYQNYGTRVDAQIVKVVGAVEGELTLDRQSTMLVRDENRGYTIEAVEGFLRITARRGFKAGPSRNFTSSR